MLVPAQLSTQIDRYQPRFVLAPSPAPLEIIFCRAVLLSRGLDDLLDLYPKNMPGLGLVVLDSGPLPELFSDPFNE